MHVCVLMPVLDAYKGGNHLPLFSALQDVSFTILCNRMKCDPGDALPSNVEVVTVPGRLGPYAYGIGDWRFARIVLRRYPQRDSFWRQFHILHLNQVLGVPFLRLRAAKVPLLYVVHHPVTADRDIAMEESSGLDRLRWLLCYALPVRWQRSLCRGAERVMTVSSTVRDRLVREYDCAAECVSVVPNGVDGEVFSPSGDAPLFDVIAVGSFLHPRKGFPYLLEAYRALAGAGFRIADVGRRSATQVATLSAIPGVTVNGPVSGDRLRALLRGSRVLLSTSLYEGFGLSLIEALACGRPAFAFGGGAVPEVLSPIDSLLVVPPRATAELIRRVRAFLTLPGEECARRGLRYRAEVLQRYSMEGAARALRALYRELCTGRGSGS